MVGPITAEQQDTVKTLVFFQPFFPVANLVTDLQTKTKNAYYDLIYPIDASLEPDAAIRTKNQTVRNLTDTSLASHTYSSANFGTTFFYGEIAKKLFVDDVGNIPSSSTFLLMVPEAWDFYINAGTASDSLDIETGNKLISYAFASEAVPANVDLSADPKSLGEDFDAFTNDARFDVVDWINEIEAIATPHEIATFGASCPNDSAVPDQPNSITLDSVSYDNAIILIGPSPCDHGLAITKYKIFRRISGVGNFVEIAEHTNLSNLLFTDATVEANTSYEYQTKATNATGDSTASNNFEVTTLVMPSEDPSTPQSLIDFLNSIVSELGGLLGNISLAISEISNDKLFEMKMLEVLISTQSDMSIANLPTLAQNQINLAKELKTASEAEVSL